MKRVVSILAVPAGALALWWALSYSASDYRVVPSSATFRNVTIATPDVRRLANFYKTTFHAVEIDQSAWVPEEASGEAVVLRTPGYGGEGPTLTLITSQRPATPVPQASDYGYAHLCFETEDMRGVADRLVASGGSITSLFHSNDRAPVLYAQDPDGNAVEIHIPLPAPLTPRTIYRTLGSLIRVKFGLDAAADDRLRFLHANHNSQDWARVAAFYRVVFGSETVGSERNYEGDFISELTGIRGVEVRGRHIEMPGYSPGGPTLEAFTYNPATWRAPLSFSDTGVVAIGFDTRNIDETVSRMATAGGAQVSRVGQTAIAQDLDGNLIQLRQVVP